MPVAPEHQPKQRNTHGGRREGSGRKPLQSLGDIQLQMHANRHHALRYVTQGVCECVRPATCERCEKIPEGLKRTLDVLMQQVVAGEMKAIKEMLNRMLGGVIQNVQIDVTDKKLITADTRAALPAGEQAAPHRVIDVTARPAPPRKSTR